MTSLPLSSFPDAIAIRDAYLSFVFLDYDSLYDELLQTGVSLSQDPLEKGITSLNVKIALVDSQKTRVAKIVADSIKNESDLEILTKKLASIYKTQFDKFITTSEISSFSNAALREAACNQILGELVELKNAVEGSFTQAKTFAKIAQNTLQKLDSTNKNISRQVTVIQLAVETGEIQRPMRPAQTSDFPEEVESSRNPYTIED